MLVSRLVLLMLIPLRIGAAPGLSEHVQGWDANGRRAVPCRCHDLVTPLREWDSWVHGWSSSAGGWPVWPPRTTC
ncbi:hypothetical protein GCM10027055_25900 [Janibacter alkaliphilus]